MAKKKSPITPEKIVEKDVLSMCKMIGLDVSVIESKAKFSENRQCYLPQETEPGFSDIAGNDPNGIAVFVELKAKGRLGTIRPNQQLFLSRKIDQGCFACCVDSAELLFDLYTKWKRLGRSVLIHHLSSISSK